MNKGVIFWTIWSAVVGGAVVCYFVLVQPQISENRVKTQQRDLLAARLIKVDKIDGVIDADATGQIRSMAKKMAEGGKGIDQDLQQKLFPAALGELVLTDDKKVVLTDLDKKIHGLYALTEPKNLKKIPNRTNVTAREDEVKVLQQERAKFVESFGKGQFGVDPLKDFQPAPPDQIDRFRQWVVGNADIPGQDQKIDRMLVEKLGEGCMKFCESRTGSGQPLEWLEDGRCSGYIDAKSETRQLVLNRLVLRRLVLMAAARASAPTQTLVSDKYGPNGLQSERETKQRRVQKIERLEFLDGAAAAGDPTKGFLAARNTRYLQAGLKAPMAQDNPCPYKPNGFKLEVRCHPAVVTSLISEIEKIGEVENRPFACWVERVVVTRPSKPDWRADAVLEKPENLPREDGGNRLHEWPVSVEILVVVPEFDEKLDKEP